MSGLEFLRSLTIPGKEHEVQTSFNQFPERMIFSLELHGAFNALRKRVGYDRTAALGALGVNSQGNFFVPKEVIFGTVIKGEAPYEQWAEIAKVAAANEDLRSIAGLVLCQEPQGWDWGKELLTAKMLYRLISPNFEPNAMVWVRPDENRIVIRTAQTKYFNSGLPTPSEPTFEAEWEARVQARAAGLRTSLSMAEDYRLVVYRGGINESIERVIPKVTSAMGK